jgi:hypothetical protein
MGLLGDKYALEVQNKYKRVQNGQKKEATIPSNLLSQCVNDI